MTVVQLGNTLGLKTLCVGDDREIVSCYISDLLSHVLGGCKEGDVWITVQTSMNMVAVAVMIEASCVIFPENVTAPDDVIERAKTEGLTLFTSQNTAFELAMKIKEAL